MVIRKKEVKPPELEEWIRRQRSAGKLVKAIGNEAQLRGLLGERYDELVGKLAAKS